MGLFKWLMGEEPGLLSKLANSGDSGHYGEYLTEYALGNNNLKGYSKTLHNVYVPYKGKTSEIDVLMIHEKGIYVFESKNYSGWIFGSADGTKWTQVLANKKKSSFYNPIMQNKTHINALSKFISCMVSDFRSYIIFSERCELKKVPENTENYFIVKRENMLKELRKELEKKEKKYSAEQVDEIYNKLFPLTQVTDEQKKQHIQEIEEAHK